MISLFRLENIMSHSLYHRCSQWKTNWKIILGIKIKVVLFSLPNKQPLGKPASPEHYCQIVTKAGVIFSLLFSQHLNFWRTIFSSSYTFNSYSKTFWAHIFCVPNTVVGASYAKLCLLDLFFPLTIGKLS